MPQEQEQFKQAIQSMLEAIIFENWIRFYFLLEEEEQPGKEARIYIGIPDQAMTRIRENYGPLIRMAEQLNGREATLDVSRNAVCDFIRSEYEGNIIPQGSLAAYFDTHSFQIDLQLFNIWVQGSETFLEQQFMDFDQWRTSFRNWCNSEHGQQIRTQLEADIRKQGH